MIRYKLFLCYIGTRYHGWQIQNNAETVQEVLENALKKLFGEPIRCCGCSRTDSGVHAQEFVCHFDSARIFDSKKLPMAINSFLPEDIAIFRAEIANEDFHARFSSKGKTYRYLVWNASVMNPFLLGRAYFYPQKLNCTRLSKLLEAFIGTHDFSAFMAQGSDVGDTVRTISSFSVSSHENLIALEVTGDGFLYNMVRIMAGTLIDADLGKLEMAIPDIIASKNRLNAGFTAPPEGLYLMKVFS